MARKSTKPAAASIALDDAKWRARDDMHTLARAREIEADRARLAAAKREASAELKKMQAIAGRKPIRK